MKKPWAFFGGIRKRIASLGKKKEFDVKAVANGYVSGRLDLNAAITEAKKGGIKQKRFLKLLSGHLEKESLDARERRNVLGHKNYSIIQYLGKLAGEWKEAHEKNDMRSADILRKRISDIIESNGLRFSAWNPKDLDEIIRYANGMKGEFMFEKIDEDIVRLGALKKEVKQRTRGEAV